MPHDFNGKSVVVAGMAKSGFGAVDILLRHGANVRAVDSKPDDAMRARLAPLGVQLVEQTPEAFRSAVCPRRRTSTGPPDFRPAPTIAQPHHPASVPRRRPAARHESDRRSTRWPESPAAR